jgi:DNA-binding transcriptional MocR family regulator
VPTGGLSLWCELPEGVDATSVAVVAEDEGLLIASGPRFSVAGGLDRWVRLPYVLDPATMTTAAERLARAVRAVADGTKSGATRPRRAQARPSRPLVA